MSITLSVKGAPTHKAEVECLCVYDGFAERECPYCLGTGKMMEIIYDGAQPVNMAGVNATAILGLFGVTGEDLYQGEFTLADLPVLRRKFMVLRAAQEARSPAVRPLRESRGQARPTTRQDGAAAIATGPLVIYCGIDDDYVLDKLTAIEALLCQAQQLGTSVVWC